MRRVLWIVLILVCPAFGQGISTVTGNNTSACAGSPLPAYCGAAFTALSTKSVDVGAQTAVVDPIPGNVSCLDIHAFLPAGTKVIAHSTDWFIFPGTGDHTQTKYNSNDVNTVAAQDTDMISCRHLDGRVTDYYGQNNAISDGSAQKINTDLSGRCSAPQNCPLEWAIVYDQGAVTRANGSRAACTSSSSAMQACIMSDLCYANGRYFGSNSYWKMNPTTHAWATSTNPVVLMFPPGDTSLWNPAVAGVKALVASNGWAATNCPAGQTPNQQTANGGLILIDTDTTNVANSQYMGGGSWVSPSTWSTTNQFLIDGPSGNYHESLYQSGNANPSFATVGSVKKGFDDSNASWCCTAATGGLTRVVAQECGQTFVSLLAKAATFTGSNLTLQLVTWNDYEEGSEIETGIDPCYRASAAPTVSNGTVSWASVLTSTDSTYAPLSAGAPTGSQVDHWKIWDQDSLGTMRVAADNIPLATTSIPLSSLALPSGNSNLYVQLVGKPNILNQTSPASVAVSPPPVTCNANPNPYGAVCQFGQWCNVFTAGLGTKTGVPIYNQNGWKTAQVMPGSWIIYDHGQADQLGDNTFCNPANPLAPGNCSNPDTSTSALGAPFSSDIFFGKDSTDTVGCPKPYVGPPYTEFYSSGSMGSPGTTHVYMQSQFGARLWLAATPHNAPNESRPLANSDTQITLCSATAACNPATQSGFINGIQDAGTIFLDDEVIDYSACTAYGSDLTTPLAAVTKSGITSNCNQQAYEYLLTIDQHCPHTASPTGGTGNQPCRGQRQGSGWSAMTAHNANDPVNHPSEGWAWLSTPKWYSTSGAAGSNGDIEYGPRFNTDGEACATGGPAACSTVGATNFLYGDNTAAGGFDGPTSRHQRDTMMMDPLRGAIWYTWGFQELIANLRDLWKKCVYVPTVAVGTPGSPFASCTAADLSKGWQHINLATAGHPYPGSPSTGPCLNTASPCQQEGSTTFIPDFGGVLYLMGGVASYNAYVMCLGDPSTNPQVVPCHTDGVISNSASYIQGQWMSVCNTTGNSGCAGAIGTPVNGFATCNTVANPTCHGYPGFRDGPVLVYDPTVHKILIIGGRNATTVACSPTNTGGVCYTEVAQWNPMTNDYCLSDTSQNSKNVTVAVVFNGAGCNTTNTALNQAPLPNNGPAPFHESTSLAYPAATWDDNAAVNATVFFKADEVTQQGGASNLWLYKAAANTWTAAAVAGGPNPPAVSTPQNPTAIFDAGQSLIHISPDSMLWYVDANLGGNFEVWELQDAALTTGSRAFGGPAQDTLPTFNDLVQAIPTNSGPHAYTVNIPAENLTEADNAGGIPTASGGPNPTAFSGQCIVQALVSAGITANDANRTNAQTYCPIPLADSDNVSPNLGSLGLDCVRVGGVCLNNSFVPQAGQFKCSATWPDGNCQLAIVRTEVPNWTANTSATFQVNLFNGSGSFGGLNLATDNGATITVNTGPAQFTIKKANFDLIDSAVVNGTQVVAPGSDGVVLVGPASVNTTNLVPAAPAAAPLATVVPCSANCSQLSRTYFYSASFTSPNGESAEGPVGGPITLTNVQSLQLTCPTPPAGVTGCNLYVGPSAGSGACAAGSGHCLQNPLFPLPNNSIWTEPTACQLTLNDGTIIALPKSGTPLSNTQCNFSNANKGGGILNYTRQPETFSEAPSPAIGSNAGCWIKDPVSGISSCTGVYKTSNDSASTAVIEENGPVRTVIRANASFRDPTPVDVNNPACPANGTVLTGFGTAHCYMHEVVRMTFTAGSSQVHTQYILQNDDYVPCSGSGTGVSCPSQSNGKIAFPAAAYKQVQAYYASLNFNGTATQYAAQVDPAATACGANDICTGTLATNDIQLYQAFSCLYLWPDGEGNLYQPGSYTAYLPPIFAYGPTSNGQCFVTPGATGATNTNTYLHEGYELSNGTTLIANGNRNANTLAMGWMDVSDSTGAGIEFGTRYMGPAFPKAVRLHSTASNTYAAQIYLLPDQTTPLAIAGQIAPGGAQPYVIAWPSYSMDDGFWDFHSAALGSESGEFLAYQAPLVGRPQNVSDWNRSQYFGELYPLIDPPTLTSFMNGTCPPSKCLTPPVPYTTAQVSTGSNYLTPNVPRYFRYYAWPGPGEGNQNEIGWQGMYKWLENGGTFSASFIYAQNFYRHLATLALPRADFAGGWRSTCAGTHCQNLDDVGFPCSPLCNRAGSGLYPSFNTAKGYHDFDDDPEHMHYFEMGQIALILDDQFLINAANQAMNDTATNPGIGKFNNVPVCNSVACYFYARAKGEKLSLSAKMYNYLQSQAYIQTGLTCAQTPSPAPFTPCADAANAITVANTLIQREMMQTGKGVGFGTDFSPGLGTTEGQNPVQGWDYQGTISNTDPDTLTTCPADLQGQCFKGGNFYNSVQGFFVSMEVEGFLDAAEAFGSSWPFYYQALDTAYGMSRWWLSEGGWIERHKISGGWGSGGTGTNCPGVCSNNPAQVCTSNTACGTGNTCTGIGVASLACYPGNPVSGAISIWRGDFYNADKPEWLGGNPRMDNQQWFNFIGAALYNGNPSTTFKDYQGNSISPLGAFDEYVTFRGTSTQENGSPEENSVVGLFLNPPLTTLTLRNNPAMQLPAVHTVDVPPTVNGVLGGNCAVASCNVTWANPVGTSLVRLKVNPYGKQIQDWVLLDTVTDPNPNGQTFFGSCAAPITGAPPEISPDAVTPVYASGKPGGHAWYGCWIDDPRVAWPWFSSTEVPLPSATSNSFTYSNTGGGTVTFAVKAYTTGTASNNQTGNCRTDLSESDTPGTIVTRANPSGTTAGHCNSN